MKPLVFHVADGAMVEGLKAFFRRKNWHYAIGCAHVAIDPDNEQDFYKVPGLNDQAVWKSAHAYLAPFEPAYERAVIVVDEHFDPSPGAEQIRADITANMIRSGWAEERFQVVVIQPMLEAWLWMESDHVAKAFGVKDYATLRAGLVKENLWERGQPKPKSANLKDACSRACRMGGSHSSRTTFKNIFGVVSSKALNRCEEPGFLLLRETLRTWFPKGKEAWEQ
jgi:hypothetical protein